MNRVPLQATDPTIAWTTIARAERLAHAGLGWTADQVLRRALDILEQKHLQPASTEAVFSTDELVAALAGDDLEPDDLDDPAYLRQLLATAEALDPDPDGRLA